MSAPLASLTGGGPAVVTGQQAGLFGGPLYTWFKLLGAVKVARHREAEAVFWIECDDADVREVDRAGVLDLEGGLQQLSLDEPHDGRPVAAHVLPPAVEATIGKLGPWLPDTEQARSALADLADAYRPGRPWHHAFRAYHLSLLGPRGLRFLDPSEPAVKRAAAPLLRRVLEDPLAVEGALEGGAASVEKPQVVPGAGELPVFLLDAQGRRRKLLRHPKGFSLKPAGAAAGEPARPEVLSTEETLQLLDSRPERFSAGVLLRPVLQDWLLPTCCYLAGPSEAAYHAQIGPLYELLGVPRPPVLPRPRVTIVGPRARRGLEKLGVDLAQALEGEEAMRRQAAVAASGLDPMTEASSALEDMEARLEELGRRLVEAAPGELGPALAEARSKIRYQVERFARRTRRLLERRDSETLARIRKLANELRPDGEPQERALAPVSFVARHGATALREQILAAIDPDDPGRHLIVEPGV